MNDERVVDVDEESEFLRPGGVLYRQTRQLVRGALVELEVAALPNAVIIHTLHVKTPVKYVQLKRQTRKYALRVENN